MSVLRSLYFNFTKTTRLIKTYKQGLACQRCCSTRVKEPQAHDDQPIQYSKSPASRWKAESSFVGTDMERLWYEPYVILGSIAIFMIYFCVLREESDVDQNFEHSLYDRIKGLEEQQLILLLKYNQEHGLETKQIEHRLNEIYRLEKIVKKN